MGVNKRDTSLTPSDEQYARLRALGYTPTQAAIETAPSDTFDHIDLWIDMRECSPMVKARIAHYRTQC